MKPLISVIIPVYNDPQGLRDTLNSLVNQKFEKSFYEIIIADNGSTDNTTNIAKYFVEKYPGLVKLIIEDKIQSSYAARNKGIVNSKGYIIAFIDADMKATPDFLKKVYDFMSGEKIEYAGFNVEMELKNKSIITLYDNFYGFKIKNNLISKHFVATACLLVRREIFNKIGFFDTRLISGGDREFGNRIWNAGYKQYFLDDIVAVHPLKNSIKGLMSRNFRIGRGIFQLSYYYPDRYFTDRRKVAVKYILPDSPVDFMRKVKAKKKEFDFPLIYIIFFYFIRWLVKIAKYRGYTYEKKLKENEKLSDSK
jgi:glycosyltransferase AglI